MIPADDTDLDTLSDVWEKSFFTNLSQNAEADFDGDGHTNGEEEFIGTNPADPGSKFLAIPEQSGETVTIRFPVADGPEYILEYSDDLSTWFEVANYEVDSDMITFIPAATRRYYRIVAQE